MKPNSTNAAGVNPAKSLVPMSIVADTQKHSAEQKEKKETKSEDGLILPKKLPSIGELKNKIEKVHLLSEKHAKLTEKLSNLEMFAIKRDIDTARMRVTDAKGEVFESSNPTSIGRLIEIWKETYVNAINEVENEMFDLMEN